MDNQLRDQSREHPSDEQLVDYLRGQLDEAGHESVQAHLVDCDQCLELFRDVRHFFESNRKNEQIITVDVTQEWRKQWNRVKDEEKTEDRIGDVGRRGVGAGLVRSFAVAATLLVAIAMAVWAIMESRQKQRFAQQLEIAELRSAQLQSEQENLVERVTQLEQESRNLQERVRSAPQSGGGKHVETREPELNVPIYDLYARNSTDRSAGQSDVNRIKAPPKASSMVFILNGEGLASAGGYTLEILNDAGQVIWRAGGLTKGHLGNFTVTIDRSFLGKGTYRLKLLEPNGRTPKPSREYLLRIE